MDVYKLSNTIQHYDWGSKTKIQELLGREDEQGRPAAELWMGAHPKAPSQVLLPEGAVSLRELIARDPEELLGSGPARRFGGNLPFLFKLLAAERALSIQAHPDKKTAEAGFDRENREGIPVDAAERNYRDDNHKPEIICALTEFNGLCGFRTAAEIYRFLHPLGIPELDPCLRPLENGRGSGGIKEFFSRLLKLESDKKQAAVDAAVRAAAENPGKAGAEREWVLRIAEDYPGDIGVLGPYFLNLFTLRPGEAAYLPAKVLHAYLEGFGIELMANSDNVLRGGLTSKHVDVEELLSVLTFEPGKPDRVPSREDEAGAAVYPAPAKEFFLHRYEPGRAGEKGISVGGRGRIGIYICTEGEGKIEAGSGGSRVDFRRGDSFLVPASAGARTLRGGCTVYGASVP